MYLCLFLCLSLDPSIYPSLRARARARSLSLSPTHTRINTHMISSWFDLHFWSAGEQAAT
jgi:hypothetical protein